VGDIAKDPRIVYGGGAIEIAVAGRLAEFGKSVGGREGLAVQGYAEALKEIPRALAENAGMDPIDTLQDLVAQSKLKGASTGLDVINKKVADMAALNVVDPLAVKKQAIKSATEAVGILLRIDDVISSTGGGAGGAGKKPSEEGEEGEEKETDTDFD
jgi:chaperonin GroEL (HSP60 family)